MNLHSKIRNFLQYRRYTTQYLLYQLKDDQCIEQALTSKHLHVWLNEPGEIDFLAYLSPGKILHIQGDPISLTDIPVVKFADVLNEGTNFVYRSPIFRPRSTLYKTWV